MSISDQPGRDVTEELSMAFGYEIPGRNIYPVQRIAEDHRWGWGRGSLRMFACKNLKPITFTVVGRLRRGTFVDRSGDPAASVRLDLTPLRPADIKSAKIIKMRLRNNLNECPDPSPLPN